ncbi:hypothetical protein [Sinomonas sp. RB5]
MSTHPRFTVATASGHGLAEIAASLPLSLAPTGGAPQIAAVDGSAGWERRAGEALAAGALAAVVGPPMAHDDGGHLPDDAAGRIVVAWGFASNPGVLAAAGAAAALRGRAVLAECRVTVPDAGLVDAALLDALTACGRVFGAFGPVETLVSGPAGQHCAGHLASGAPLALALVVSAAGPAALTLRLLTEDGGLTAHVPSAATAAPAEVRIVGPDGERLLPTRWETSRRASWRRAIAIAAGGPASGDVAEFHRTAPLVPPRADGGTHT